MSSGEGCVWDTWPCGVVEVSVEVDIDSCSPGKFEAVGKWWSGAVPVCVDLADVVCEKVCCAVVVTWTDACDGMGRSWVCLVRRD